MGKKKKNKKKISFLDIYQGIRKFWNMSPVTKIKKSKKIYSRKKAKRQLKKEINNED